MVEFQKTGAELDQKERIFQQSNDDIILDVKVRRGDEKIVINFLTYLGDQFRVEEETKGTLFFLSYCKEILQLANDLQLQDTYMLLPDTKEIYLFPNIYWNYYKGNHTGKAIVSNKAKKLKIYINDVQYKFVSTSSYFDTEFLNKIGEERGIYGIFYQDELLYIGSSTSGLIKRWKEHDLQFRVKMSKYMNKMYVDPDIDADKVEYKLLISLDETRKILERENVSGWVLEHLEKQCIENIQTKYNIRGATKAFTFQASKNYFVDKDFDEEKDYWPILKQFLIGNERLDNKFFKEKQVEEGAE